MQLSTVQYLNDDINENIDKLSEITEMNIYGHICNLTLLYLSLCMYVVRLFQKIQKFFNQSVELVFYGEGV